MKVVFNVQNNKDKALKDFVNEFIAVFSDSGLTMPIETTVNVYHHCGIENIRKTGAVFMNVVNEVYCKSYVIMTLGQHYPDHYHRIKTESFFVHYGTLCVTVDEKEYVLKPGEILNIGRGQNHSFFTDTGTVFEELSTKYVPNDSVYIDEKIAKTTYAERRTTFDSEQWKEIVRKWKR